MAKERVIVFPASTDRILQFLTTYSADWSEVAKRGDDIEAAEVEEAEFLLKKRLLDDNDDAVVTKLLSVGATDMTIASGEIRVILAPEDTAGLKGKYYGTLRITLTTGAVIDWEDVDYAGVPYIVCNIAQGAVLLVEP